MNALQRLHEAGQSLWLDNITADLKGTFYIPDLKGTFYIFAFLALPRGGKLASRPSRLAVS